MRETPLTSMIRPTSSEGKFLHYFAIATFFLCSGRDALAIPGTQAEKAPTIQRVRECPAGFSDPGGTGRRNSAHRKKQVEAAAPQSCVEVHGSSLAVQEYLQKAVWDLRWTVNDEQATEEMWSFSMGLSAEELLRYAKIFSDPKVDWSAGKAVVNARTSELADGFTRLIVTAKFEGYGTPEDKFAPKRQSWPLSSNGALEAKITNVVKEHFQTGR